MDIHLCPLQPDGQIIHRIDVQQSDKSSQKESDLYFKQQTRKPFFCILHFCHLQPDGQTIHRKAVQQLDKSSEKKNQTSILNSRRENHVFVFLNFCHLISLQPLSQAPQWKMSYSTFLLRLSWLQKLYKSVSTQSMKTRHIRLINQLIWVKCER